MERKILTAILTLMLVWGPGAGLIWADGPAASLSAGVSVPDLIDEEDPEEDDLLIDELLQESTGEPVAHLPAGQRGSSMPFRYEGELAASVWGPDANNHNYTYNRLDVTAFGNLVDLDIHGRFRVNTHNLEGKTRSDADVRELYATYRMPGPAEGIRTRIALGKKMIYWGKADEIRPLDRICAQDYTAFLFDDLNERKTGRLGLFPSMKLNSGIRFEGFWSPYFEPSQTPGLGDYFEPAALRRLSDKGIRVEDSDGDDTWSGRAGYGGRVIFSLFKADMALYAYHGYDPMPTYQVSQTGIHPLLNLPVVPLGVSSVHPRITFWGADIERSIGSFVFRAEAAYQSEGAFFNVDWPNNPLLLLAHPRGIIEKEQVEYVIGMDRNDLLIHNLFLNLQIFGNRIIDHEAVMTSPRSKTGLTGLLRYSFLDSRMTASLRTTFFYDGGGTRHHIRVDYKFRPWGQISLGGICYGGNDDLNEIGQYGNRDFIYAKIKLIF